MIALLKDLPISYKGELHEVKLVQFSLDPEEARAHLPPQFIPMLFNGRAIVSLVDVNLKKMRPAPFPALLGVSYRHIAFRFLIDDRAFTGDSTGHGIFFVRSFTDTPLVVPPAHYLTHYQLRCSEIEDTGNRISVREGHRQVTYAIGLKTSALSGAAFRSWDHAKEVIGVIDRAYALNGKGRVVVTKIIRPGWPIVPIDVADFSTNFFRSAELECGFQVVEPIQYRWLAPRVVGGE